MKLKKAIAIALAIASVTAVAGCKKGNNADGKVTLSIGVWPDETEQEALKAKNELKDEFMAENPDINLVGDVYRYDTKTFMMKASANQLPTRYSTWFTEIKQIIDQGYAADITEYMKKYNFDKTLNPDLIKFVTGEDGKIYGIPHDGYEQALYINKNLFKEAGLVNSDGTIKVPDSWQELAEYSKIIKEKTGKAGFGFPTTNNCGGWQFLNIAWAFGVEFEKQNDDGKWEATFDTPETKAALQYVKDLKWKYNALLDDTVINLDDLHKYFGSGQAAMMLKDVPFSGYKYGTDNSAFYATKVPKGEKGRFSQMGGNIYVFANNATPEQIDAGFKWTMFEGFTPNLTEKELKNKEKDYQREIAEHGVITPREAFQVWTDPETVKKNNELREKYANVDYDDYKSYFEATDVTIKPEPTACAQQLYAILDSCVQEVITNKDADVDKLISDACKDFQVNHLDKM